MNINNTGTGAFLSILLIVLLSIGFGLLFNHSLEDITIRQLRDEKTKLEEVIQNLNEQLSEKNDTNNELVNQIADLKKKIDDLNNQISSLDQENGRLKHEIAADHQKIATPTNIDAEKCQPTQVPTDSGITKGTQVPIPTTGSGSSDKPPVLVTLLGEENIWMVTFPPLLLFIVFILVIFMPRKKSVHLS